MFGTHFVRVGLHRELLNSSFCLVQSSIRNALFDIVLRARPESLRALGLGLTRCRRRGSASPATPWPPKASATPRGIVFNAQFVNDVRTYTF